MSDHVHASALFEPPDASFVVFVPILLQFGEVAKRTENIVAQLLSDEVKVMQQFVESTIHDTETFIEFDSNGFEVSLRRW